MSESATLAEAPRGAVVPAWHSSSIQSALKDPAWVSAVASASRLSIDVSTDTPTQGLPPDLGRDLVQRRFPALSDNQAEELTRMCSRWSSFRDDGRTAAELKLDPYQMEARVASRRVLRQEMERRRQIDKRMERDLRREERERQDLLQRLRSFAQHSPRSPQSGDDVDEQDLY
jgi:hypothetical protein